QGFHHFGVKPGLDHIELEFVSVEVRSVLRVNDRLLPGGLQSEPCLSDPTLPVDDDLERLLYLASRLDHQPFPPVVFRYSRVIWVAISADHCLSPTIRAAKAISSSLTIRFTQLVCCQRLSPIRSQSFGPIRWVFSFRPSPNLTYKSANIL